ncbi:class I poly(R)-hydroxyalkanoic acid synthase [Candidatus Berkiella aquae]|uniref:Class I poly(R)-hydroxyalkanoic acid synthase n=1 Tax=Candidatus Berkiella aquae TaxID=295108 RepID=A0A0Q9YVH7_9GAMM|nr:class I poly(R)-hydroxyalkanoic acid synthase [Candidatus Berkiella aquae]MCS5710765.1 class I poly(R)-hydroxyalkanoic acid synthase [Candidatus Berkiella aquae]
MKIDEGYVKLFADSLEMSQSFFQSMQILWQNQQIFYDNFAEFSLINDKIQSWRAEIVRRTPERFFNAYAGLSLEYYQLIHHCYEKMVNKAIPPFIEVASHDKRFRSNQWHDNIIFYVYQQSYLLYVKHVIAYIESNDRDDHKKHEQIHFFAKQFLNALSPSNYWLTNPDVFFKTLDQKGENLFSGWKRFIADLQRGEGYLNPMMVEKEAYSIGKDIAATPGKVVFKNRLIELIQYSPATPEVYEIPLLVIPPWINKYYVLDLRQDNSFVKWIAEQGYTVFIISWAAIDETYADTGFADYMLEGIIPATEEIMKITKLEKLNALGFCIGGTLLCMTMAYLAAKQDKRIHSATFLATLIDFKEPGDLGLYVDEQQFALIKNSLTKKGYFDGRSLMGIFNLLRANELYWPYIINNYLLAQHLHSFDLLYWNQDSTHLPAKMMCEYLENLYLKNKFFNNQLVWNNTPLLLKNIHVPCYFLATEQDHIAPWLACFSGAKQFTDNVTFVLGGSGHIAGIVNPPQAHKYGYYVNEKAISDFMSPAVWLQEAIKQEGSWWEHWQSWLSHLSGKKISARKPAKHFSDAPGENVKVSIYKKR